jgi:hypothetical protein
MQLRLSLRFGRQFTELNRAVINSSKLTDQQTVKVTIKFFKSVFNGKAKGLENYEVISKKTNVSNPGYKHSDATTPVGGQINEVILKKRKK